MRLTRRVSLRVCAGSMEVANTSPQEAPGVSTARSCNKKMLLSTRVPDILLTYHFIPNSKNLTQKKNSKKSTGRLSDFLKGAILNSQFAHPLLRMLVSARVWCTEGEKDTRGGSRGILQSQTSLTEAISGK